MEDKPAEDMEESEPSPPSPARECLKLGPALVKTWMICLAEGQPLGPSFRAFWKEAVPFVYRLEKSENDAMDWQFCKDEPVLFSVLEKLMWGGSDIKDMLDRLSTPSLCGRMFKFGEPTYACRECGVDSTCVFCAHCFKKSVHQHHKYKMSKSPGGGRCDCGDTEAWKSDPYCDDHLEGLQKQQLNKQFPQDIAMRARIVFEIVLAYAFELLTLKYSVSLPSDLKQTDDTPLRMEADCYCLVLYNDEAHTFEQVFDAMNKVMKGDPRELNDLVTRVDREGRAIIKTSNFQVCSELKLELEKCSSRQNNQPIKVQVLHVDVVSHQVFALKLLDWLQRIVQTAEGFRNVFASVVLETGADRSVVERVLLEDANMWKAARTAWHHLFMSGLLMEYESKKALARVFTKKYGQITKEYIRDDHDRHVSIASLSVQLFTVPTLAHYLMAEERALFILWNSFLSECLRKVKDKKLVFERNASNVHLRRAMEVLADIKFLLSVQPKEWNDELRKGFLQGLAPLCHLMIYMQDMDPVKRQVGQHVEYEPEWETGFLLHMKMASIATQVVEWCGSDRVVLIKAYRLLLSKLHELASETKPIMETQELADHSATCQVYDVSSEHVSIHLPLTRLLAGLHLHLERHGLTFDSPEVQVSNKPSPQQLVEPVLRLQVMIAQVHAGMWRRNGYSLITQIGLYHGVRCRTEMLDRDVIMLQVAASLIESNEFLIMVLHKFNLLNWANPNFERNPDEDGMRRTINLVEEFLGLLVTIVGERFTPGVGKVTSEEQTKKEIIQQLCIRPLSHSELYTTFPYEEMQENGIEAVIDQVADFNKPNNRKGVYELKEDLHSEYNVFYYHYTREERSRSEEKQRKRNKTRNPGREDMDCCPPPQLPLLTESFSMIANLLQCDVMLHVLHVVLSRAADLRAQSFSEVQLHKALHLMGYALQEQEREPEGFLLFTERAERWRLERLLEELSSSARVEALKGMIKWVLGKYRAVKKSRQPRAAPGAEPVVAQSQAEFLAAKDKEWRAKMAAEKRAKIMAQMMAMQNSFMKENANMFQNAEGKEGEEEREMEQDVVEWNDSPVALGPGQTHPALQSQSHTCILCQEEETVSTTGPALVLAAYVQKSAVLARSCTKVNVELPENAPIFLPSWLGPAPHTSTCGHVMHASCWKQYYDNVMTKENRRPYRLRQPASFDIEHKEFLCPLCACLSNTVLPLLPALPSIVDAVSAASTRQEDVSFSDWVMNLMPDCRPKPKREADASHTMDAQGAVEKPSVANAGDGAAPSLAQPAKEKPQGGDGIQPGDDVEVIAHVVHHDRLGIMQLSEDEVAEDADSDSESHGARSAKRVQREPKEGAAAPRTEPALEPGVEMADDLANMILEFMRASYEKSLGPIHDDSDERQVPIMAWQSCSYTIRSLEVLLRDDCKPLFGEMSSRQHDCLQSLVRMMGMVTTAWRRPACVLGHAHLMLSLITNSRSTTSCVLDWDSFGMLVPAVFLLAKTPVPIGKGYESHALRLALISETVKYLLSVNLNSEEQNWSFDDAPPQSSMDVDEVPGESSISPQDLTVMNELLALILHETKRPADRMPNPQQLWDRVKVACQPFLRCASLFFHFLTAVPTPPVLSTPGGDTFNNMCAYLGITESWRDLLLNDIIKALVKLWTNHSRIKLYLDDKESMAGVLSMRINHFVTLPEDYSELMNSVSEFYCRKWVESRNPTMCLVCGEMLCSQNYCCQRELGSVTVGACTYHAAKCGAGCGIFLRVRECEVLLLALPNRGTFMTSPYVDDYGETDQGLRRGNRLRLCPELYRNLERLWLSHGIREYVSRSIDRGANQIIGQWHQF